mmetsp:Transcript_59272/g.105351  ORF Transcript_59272/g.105351 Transcript_59272/m.105351 type:complete len:382 (-) Transcript_59272:115-1260(-)
MGQVGGACIRDCSRPEDGDEQQLVKLMPLLCPGTSNSKVSIERVNTDRSDQQEPRESSDSQMELPVTPGNRQVLFPSAELQNISTQRPNPSSSSSSIPRRDAKAPPNGDPLSTPQREAPVPAVKNWFQVYQKPGQDLPKESPRFDEVSVAATPRTSIGGEFQTPGRSPRAPDAPQASPRDSPRPPDEGGREQTEELLYEGTYLGTMKHGTGRLRMQNYTYEGEFQNDLKHGVGVLEWDDGRRFEGGFRNGKFHGAAIMHWPDGRRYIGHYSEDRKHGDGTFSWQDGRRYEGQWVNGKRHGIGTYTNAKGFTRRGTWQQDRPIQWDDPTPMTGPASPGPVGSPVAASSPRQPHLAPEKTTEIDSPNSKIILEAEEPLEVSNL